MEVVKVLGILCIFAPLAASWTQQYGNSASTNFVNYQGPPYVGWNYSAEMSPGAGSTGMGSPSVSDEGMLFYYSKNSLIALSPKGTLLWDVEVAPIDAFDTSVTNSVYSKVHNIAVAAANWQFLTNHTTYFQMVAVHAGDGSVAWKVMDSDLYDATLICLSTSADAVYVGGFDHGTFAALSLKDGSIVWKKTNIYQIGLFMQTKVGPTEVSASEYEDVRTQEAVLLPTDPVIGINPKAGRLFSYDVSAGLTNWQSDLGFSFAAKFGISNQGMVFGSDWGGILGFGKSIFGIHSRDGSHIFNSKDYCDPSARGDGSYASGPAVDAEGYAYYSCGNQVFSIFPNGSLRWITPATMNASSNRIISPSIHPDGYVYYVYSVVGHDNEVTRQVLALSTRDGSLHKKYNVLQRYYMYIEPPILLGSEVMYLVAIRLVQQQFFFVIYSVEL